MEITEVRIKLMDDPQERLQAFCSITFDSCFVVRDLKIIEGAKGSFVAMPSRKLTDHCPQCNTKNHLRALHCNQCGAKLQEDRACKDDDGRAKLYADIAHPINSRCREMIQTRVLESFEIEVVRANEPGYICRYDDYGEDSFATLADDQPTSDQQPEQSRVEPKTETVEPSFLATVRSGDSVHRIEAGKELPGTPHQRPVPQQRPGPQPTPDQAIAGRIEPAVEDGFGDGILQ